MISITAAVRPVDGLRPAQQRSAAQRPYALLRSLWTCVTSQLVADGEGGGAWHGRAARQRAFTLEGDATVALIGWMGQSGTGTRHACRLEGKVVEENNDEK